MNLVLGMLSLTVPTNWFNLDVLIQNIKLDGLDCAGEIIV